jgi:DNA (cytosine-5)-methyltransferase 1
LFVMADAEDDLGWPGECGAQEGTRQDGIRRRRPPISGGDVADPGQPGLPFTEQRGETGAAKRGLETGPAAAELRGGPLPVFAPGPSDPRWLEVLRDAPHLEPSICRVDARLAYRVDQLRACGNGVTSLAAAYAWRTLDAALRLERETRERVAVVAP